MGAYPLQARDGTRTHDLFLTKEVLCRLSYASTAKQTGGMVVQSPNPAAAGL
jgi:hypothetical protein